MDWIQKRAEGLFVVPGNFYLDPEKPIKTCVVSHAHGDHFSPGCMEVFATLPSLKIMQYRCGQRAGKKLIPCTYEQSFRIGEVDITLYPAGHIPGSAMVFMEYAGESILYSGDINLRPHSMAEALVYPAKKVQALITECTFADKPFVQEEPETALEELLTRLGQNRVLMLGVYALGKAQRMLRLLQDHYPNLPVMAHHSILEYNRLYKSLGFDPGNCNPYRRDSLSGLISPVLLMPPHAFYRMCASGKYYAAFVSGWDKKNPGTGIQDVLPVSDHPDAKSLRTFISTLQPDILIPVHGDSKSLKHWTQERNIRMQYL